ncbi:MAG: CPBP family intramembrane metalloprotease [Verrucomicrobiota bacterium JB022]|nr:CPBP family intramembrane metalloprotease [Verrucomicrobiota bacterium JB022]
MNESPLIMLLVAAGAAYLGKLWWADLQAHRRGEPNPKAFPGAVPSPLLPIWIAIGGALALVALETGGEYALGVSADQSDISWLYLLPMLAAGFGEELIFRGYLVVTKKGKAVLWASIVGFSLLFALAHYQYYTEQAEGAAWYQFSWALDKQAAWALLLLFLNSLWFYTVRFWSLNPDRSLLPCIAAHMSSNLAVFLVKLAQGHVTSLA